MSPPHRQSVSRRGFLAEMAALSAVGAFALSAYGATAAPASTVAVPPDPDTPVPGPAADLVAHTPRTIEGNAMLHQKISTATRQLAPEGPLSVSGAPNLPGGFTDIFTSRFVDTSEVRLHAVIGGFGPPLLLIHGWPGSWYYWRLVMPALARDFTVIAVDQRGIGLSDKPEEGYDTATLANDLVGLMDALGHQRFAVVGVDTGMLIAYALAADHPDRVVRLAVGEAPLPGITPPNPLILPDQVVDRLWHIPFNQLKETNEKLVRGREDVFFGAEFAASAGTKKLPAETVQYYVDGLASSPEALHGSFQLYRAFGATAAQNVERVNRRLPMPVLAMGGAESSGVMVAETMKLAADDVQALVIPGIGHWLAEQAPEELLAALTAFLAPYRDGQDLAH